MTPGSRNLGSDLGLEKLGIDLGFEKFGSASKRPVPPNLKIDRILSDLSLAGFN